MVKKFNDQKFDLLIIGGGITGAALAYDAATRGMAVALFEKSDFGSATSSASSKLLHGGIRYLQQARLDKLRESAIERVYFRNLAPHLCRIVPFLVPSYDDIRKGRAALAAAALTYELVTLGQNRKSVWKDCSIPRVSWMAPGELASSAPLVGSLAGVNGALVLPECHMVSSERMTLALIQGAAAAGAVVENYHVVEALLWKSNRVIGVEVRDLESGDCRIAEGSIVANCSGPWIRGFDRQQVAGADSPITGYSRGAHIVVKGPELEFALALPTRQKIRGLADRGGRHMFIIPWRGHNLIGTSYDAHSDDLDDVQATSTDVLQLIEGVNDAVGCELIRYEDIVHAFAGIYPLTDEKIESGVYQGTGEYAIVDHYRTSGVAGYVSVFGAKFTTARRLAERACDRLAASIEGSFSRCRTHRQPTPSASYPSVKHLMSECFAKRPTEVSDATVGHLVSTYGSNAQDILQMAVERPELAAVLGYNRPNIAAEAVYSAQVESVKRLEDFVFRRTGLGTIGNPGNSVLETAASYLADELGWSADRRERELASTLSQFPIDTEVGCGKA